MNKITIECKNCGKRGNLEFAGTVESVKYGLEIEYECKRCGRFILFNVEKGNIRRVEIGEVTGNGFYLAKEGSDAVTFTEWNRYAEKYEKSPGIRHMWEHIFVTSENKTRPKRDDYYKLAKMFIPDLDKTEFETRMEGRHMYEDFVYREKVDLLQVKEAETLFINCLVW